MGNSGSGGSRAILCRGWVGRVSSILPMESLALLCHLPEAASNHEHLEKRAAEPSFALLPLLGPQHLCPEPLHPPALSGSSCLASRGGHHAIRSGLAHPSEINEHRLLPGCGGQAKATRQRRDGEDMDGNAPRVILIRNSHAATSTVYTI